MSLSESLFSLDEEMGSMSDDSVESGSYGSGVSSNSSSTNYSRRSFKEEEATDDESLATKESKDLVMYRFFLVTVLFWSTVGVGMAVWIYFLDEINEEFGELYAEEADALFDRLARKFLVAFGAIDSFVLALSTQFANWPFVTVPQFSAQADKLLKLTSALVITNYHFVEKNQREQWKAYSASHDYWLEDETPNQQINRSSQTPSLHGFHSTNKSINGNVFNLERNSSFMPRWQQYPVSDASPYGWDGFQYKGLADAWETFKNGRQAVFSYIINIPTIVDPDLDIEERNEFIGYFVGDNTHHTEPFCDIFFPIIKDVEDNVSEGNGSTDDFFTKGVVGVVAVTFYWRDMLKSLFKEKIDGLYIVVENSCNQTFTYTWSESEPNYLGSGDFHESTFEDFKKSFQLSDIGMYYGTELKPGGCQYQIHTYPSSKMFTDFEETQPIPSAIAGSSVTIFIFTSMVFFGYACLVERRQRKVYSSAVKNNAIVSSLFPKNVRERLYQENSTRSGPFQPAKTRMKSFIADGSSSNHTNMSMSVKDTNTAENQAGSPIADLFSNCTVLFADISGFTSWSSERSPGQVFILLESIYGAFDRIADRRGVFKVETIGDSYMAVTGLPNPRKDHAVSMARFARDCRDELNVLTRSLEVSLGPETSELTMRFGLHSGPVTAGVLRGQKSRFQLFGDTVNTASRMESTGICNRIHASEDTAKLLVEAGKSSWLSPRSDTITAKGKGELITFWLFDKQFNKRGSTCSSTVTSDSNGSIGSTIHSSSMHVKNLINDKRGRLLDWNVDLFAGLIRKIVARRRAQNQTRKSTLKAKEKFIKIGQRKSSQKSKENVVKIGDEISISSSSTPGMVLDEVVEIIELPAFDPEIVALQEDHLLIINLGISVMVELRDYICTISQKYKKNAFHNFEHASHVTMSVAKLLSRIVAPDLEIAPAECNSTLHDHTYGITSDPLTQFACILAALIHDVDHQGVPNTRLVEEEDSIAIKYDGRSAAEQNSVDISWALFLEPQFSELRDAVCPTDKELNRLRQLVVNMVLATDIMDKDLKKLRNQRWEKAFSSDVVDKNETNQNKINRKATIVLEHLIQASDVCHTMQHWHVYRKWNERLFEEMYFAYKIGRADVDPSTFWYNGELGFFDHYIIPLSKKLSDCGVFGVSSDEYLNYALRNRKEWEQRGDAIVTEMVERLQEKRNDT